MSVALLALVLGFQAPARPDSVKPAPATAGMVEEKPIQTHHSITIGKAPNARTLTYTVTTGRLPLRSDKGEIEGQVFYMAYTLDGVTDRSRRPLMFSFNGGPGSASVWLHLGALGPRRVRMEDEGWLPAPPYQLVDNDQTWFEFTDLVFIDPVGTGFSRAATPELGKKFWSLKGDIASVGEFIRLYLTRGERWTSPLYVVGESYGTTRAAGLSGWLVDHGIALNGVVLVSTILNFGTTDWTTGNDLPYALMVPTYTATAWYHKKLAAELQNRPLREVLDESERWVLDEYIPGLARGDRLSPDQRRRQGDQLARFTGLDRGFVERSNQRIELGRFETELLRDRNRAVGRLDTRFQGISAIQGSEYPDFDPSMAAIRPPYTAMFNDYVRRELGYQSDLEYYILGGGIGARWNFDSDNGYIDVGETLRGAFARNPHMRLFIAFGYYDAATPYFAAEYSVEHLRLDPSLKGSVKRGYYPAGHMMYIHQPSLVQLRKDVGDFVGAR